jgi:FtsP/CotA-like multicopper oxidase with cupredoxin domain
MLGLLDTITLPSQVGDAPGTVKIKIPFTDPIIVGRFVFHCHVGKHEDKGMMQTIDVAETRSHDVSSGARPR